MFGLVYIVLLAIAAYLFIPDYWYLWFLLVSVVLFRLITWTSKKQKYECTMCGADFSQEKRRISFVPKAADLYEKEKALKCPKCGSSKVKMIEAKK